MAIRKTTGPINAPLAPVVIAGAEYQAVQAMGAGAHYWRVFERAVTGAGTADFALTARAGDTPLHPKLSTGTGPELGEDNNVSYLAFNGQTNDVLITPDGIEALPTDPFALIVTAYQGPNAEGVIAGNSAYMTTDNDPDNDYWQGLITGIYGNDDDLAGCTSGQNARVTAPDASTYRDNKWHVISLLFSGGASDTLRLRVDGVEIASGTDLAKPQTSSGYRRLMVGGALNGVSPMSPFFGRINAVAAMPRDLNNSPDLATIETYLGSVVGLDL
ncbi:hypothetical protein J7426_14280 [Tropicibacter sp. R16_0]|uniref:LamG-like jellyroll fold domain-containing protein n=1 Tax=Tropicibacter sp. R16_0 TaxID=2821102 RepID=UPI001ADAFA7D|nr:LamG-like jellyroll fold domain-containing protein [Tropicibacter sp. R16_0]MBO9451437.1 hypothetical protein [Tropicibacter sp. R16_0]